MLEKFDSQVIHAIDQRVLVKSEPVYENEEFHILLPDNPGALMGSVLIDNETLNQILDEYVTELTKELQFNVWTKVKVVVHGAYQKTFLYELFCLFLSGHRSFSS